MTAPSRPFRSDDGAPFAPGNPVTHGGQMSLPKVLDPRAFRARFADHWSAFLRAHYRNPEQVAERFGVTFQTACNWWHGSNRPSGDVVALAGRDFVAFMEAQK